MLEKRAQAPDAVVKGAEVRPEDLIGTRYQAKFINVSAASKTLAHLAGAKRSQRRGRGVEFEEVRQYAAGDDIRAIDWRVTARSGEPHTKLFHEEKERPVLVAVDLRKPMKFGSVNCFKSVLAAHCASLLLWSALQHGERVGGMVFGDEHAQDTRPRRSKHAVLSMVQSMVAAGELSGEAPNTVISLDAHIEKLQRITRPGASIFIISDFADIEPEALKEALRPLAKLAQVTAIRITDPLDSSLPSAGIYGVTDGVERAVLDTRNNRLCDEYRSDSALRSEQLIHALRQLRIPMFDISNTESPVAVLQRVFPKR